MVEELLGFERLVRSRKTTKVLAEHDWPTTNGKELIERIVACAGWAPFHRACENIHRSSEWNTDTQLSGIEPWRFHLVNSENCRRLRTITNTMEAAGKIPAMLASAEALAIATWLPNAPQQSKSEEYGSLESTHSRTGVADADSEYFEATLENVEHIAAAAAAVQSLLLAATAAGLQNYWSSGGVLRSPEVLTRLGIPLNQRVLGAVFLFPAAATHSPPAQIVGSKLRDNRGAFPAWSRWVSISEESS